MKRKKLPLPTVEQIKRCVAALKDALALRENAPSDRLRQVGRSAAIQEFEIILELVIRMLKLAKKQGRPGAERILSQWTSRYSDIRNATSHEYGGEVAEKALERLPQFLLEVEKFVIMEESNDDN